MTDIGVAATLLEAPVVVSNTAVAAVAFVLVDALAPSVEGVEAEARGVALLHAEGRAVVGVMPEVRKQVDRTELGIGLVILGCREDLIQQVDVVRNVQRDGVGVPNVDQSDTRLSLVGRIENEIPGKFPLNTA